jgi:hypothetical protein
MSPKAVERNHKARNIKRIADINPLTIKRDDGCAPTQDREEEVVTHSDLKILNRLV